MKRSLAYAGLLLGLPVAIAEGQAEPFLYSSPAFLSGGTTQAAAAGDIDLDGRMDLAVADLSDGGIQVYLQSIPQAFAPALDVGAGSGYVEVALFDLDDDGFLDLLAIDSAPVSNLLIASGDGTGVFASQSSIALAGRGEALESADLNGDGNLDIAVALPDAGEVETLLGNGDGTFAASQTFTAAPGVSNLDIGDIDQDGLLDMIAVSQTGGIALMAGDGTGAFLGPQILPSVQASQARLVDLEGDGDLDIAGISGQFQLLITLENTGGGFAPASSNFVQESGTSFALADMDNDGILDAIVGPGGGEQLVQGYTVSVYLGNGIGGFSTLGRNVGDSKVSDATRDLVLADFDGDGSSDVLAVLPQRDAAILYTGDGSGDLLSPPEYRIGASPRVMRVADLNGDGIQDVIAANLILIGANGVVVSLGQADGSYSQGTPFTFPSEDMDLEDFNLDGIMDFVYRQSNGTQMRTEVGNGDGTFSPSSVLNEDKRYISFDTGRIDADAFPDLVAISKTEGFVLIALGDGTGGLLSGGEQLPLGGGSPDDVDVCDFDGDGDMDAVIADPSIPGLILLSNDGQGDLSTRTDIVVSDLSTGIVKHADLDRDGILDLAATGVDQVVVLKGQGGGSFAAPLLVPLKGAFLFDIGDINRDGWPDFVGAATSVLSIALGDGTGGFMPSFGYGSLDTVETFAISDLDGDGWSELLVSETQNGTMRVYNNLAPSSARTRVRVGNGVNPLVFSSTSAPILGGNWNSAIDTTGFPSALMTVVIVADRGLAPLPSPFGELLIGLPPFGSLLTGSLQGISNGSSAHAFALPADTTLVGTLVASQAALLGSGPCLTNAIDLVLGDS